MSNEKHYPLHPNATHPPVMTGEIPLEEYESLKRENAELKAENERLVKCCKEYESRQRIDERIKFNGSKKLRATKRALWIARAERAVAEQTVDEWSRYKEKNPFGQWRANPFEHWVQAWIYVEKLCRKKAKGFI